MSLIKAQRWSQPTWAVCKSNCPSASIMDELWWSTFVSKGEFSSVSAWRRPVGSTDSSASTEPVWESEQAERCQTATHNATIYTISWQSPSCQSGQGSKPFLRLWDSVEPRWEPLDTNAESEEQWEPSQEPVATNMTPRAHRHPGAHKEPRTTWKSCRPQLRSSLNNKKENPWRKPLQSKKNTKDGLTSSNNMLMVPFGKDSVDWWDKSFLTALSPVTSETNTASMKRSQQSHM